MKGNTIYWKNLSNAQIEWLREVLANNIADLVYDARKSGVSRSMLSKDELEELFARIKRI